MKKFVAGSIFGTFIGLIVALIFGIAGFTGFLYFISDTKIKQDEQKREEHKRLYEKYQQEELKKAQEQN